MTNREDVTRRKRTHATPRGSFWLRFGGAHFLSYPLAFAAALAGVPLAMVARDQAVLNAANEQAAQRLVLEVCIALALSVYVLVHLYALPWSLAAAAVVRKEPNAQVRQRRGFMIFVLASLATAFASVSGALVGWVWLLTA